MSATPRPDSWMPWYIGDYLADTMHLRTEGHGAYLLLIGAYWVRGGPLPDDDDQLAAITRMDDRGWKRMRKMLQPYFRIADGLWHHKRIDKELAEAADAYARRKARSDAANAAKEAAKATNKETNKVADKDTDKVADKETEKPPDKETVEGTQPQPQPQPQSLLRERGAPANGSAGKAPPMPATPIPKGWAYGAETVQFATLKGISREVLDQQAELFNLHYLASGEMRSDWTATFHKWLLRRGQFDPKQAPAKQKAAEVYIP